MKRFTAFCAATLFAASALDASPLCSEFLNPDAMPKKYQKLAPVLSGAPTDWIITKDQMDVDYAPSDEAARLLAEIVKEFESRGTQLAILMPPPRPLIAGQEALEGLAGDAGDLDVATVSASFNQMIEIVQDAGAIAPNLLQRAIDDEELRDAFYYKHDTHWTPQGAAASAVALAEAVIAAGAPAFKGRHVTRPTLESDEVFSERGSLADMTKAVCGYAIPPVVLTIPAFPKAATGLLDDTGPGPHVILAGSSFSNRYKKDAYRVADAIAGALNADVINHSVSGGGAIGAVEGIVNAGLLATQTPVDLVVWEIPYTEGLRNIGMFRQLLGALQFEVDGVSALSVDLDMSGKTDISFDGATPEVLALHLPDATLQRLKVDLRFADGSKQTLGLVRKNHVPAALQSDWWAVSLTSLGDRHPVSARIRFDGNSIGAAARVHLY